MKYIDQSGPPRYFLNDIVPEFSRFDHSIGVWALVKKFSRSKFECYAALLHDSSFPAFSHMSDFLINLLEEDGVVDQNNCYQDRTHVEYLKKSGICELLNKITKVSIEQLDFGNKSYT
ncbi:MAG: hypothetical protein LBD32_01825 [Cytophagales bacterium]|jgi:HD superfamily phosphohydrolase|nr:hypothetical protein [Cytophagales bacterium]